MSSIDPEVVYEAVRQIPPGTVITYGDLAVRVGQPRSSARAMGNVLRGRPDREAWQTSPAEDLDIPWWRVVRSDGTLRADEDGERRRGVEWAKAQLAREGVAFTDDGRIASLAGSSHLTGDGGRRSRDRSPRNALPEPCWRHDTVQYSCRECAPVR